MSQFSRFQPSVTGWSRGVEAHPGTEPRGGLQAGSYGYRRNEAAPEAIRRVAEAIVEEKTNIIDLDLRAYFDTVRHYRAERRWRNECTMKR